MHSLLSSYKGQSGWIVGRKDLGAINQYNKMIDDGLTPSAQRTEQLFKNGNKEIMKYVQSLDGAKVKTQQFGSATVVGATGLKGMATAAKLVGKELLLAGAQFAIFAAVSWGVSKAVEGLVYLYDKYSMSVKAAGKRAEEAAAELEDNRSQIESLNSELETTRDRIEELQSKGSLSITEKSELEQLRLQNAELTRQIALRKQLEDRQALDASKTAMDAINAYTNTPSDRWDGNWNENPEMGDLADQIQHYSSLVNGLQRTIDNLDPADRNYDKKIDEYSARRDEYERKLSELLDAASTHRNNIIYDELNDVDQNLVDKLDGVINHYLYNSGAMSIDDIINTSLSTDEINKFNATVQQLTDDTSNNLKIVKEDIENAFSKESLDVLRKYGISASELAEHINSLRNTGDVVSKVISGNSNFSDIQNTIDEITSSDFEITTESIASAVGDAFVNALDKAGISISDFCNWLSAMQDAAEDIDIKDVTDNFKTIEENISSLEDAYKEFRDNNGEVSDATLAGLAEEFSSLNSNGELDNLIKVLGNASSSVSEVESAMDRLVDSYFNQESVLKTLNEEYKDLHINRLKQLGVSNAEAVVEYKLAMATLENADASEEAKQEAAELAANTWDVVSALDNEAMAALSAGDKLDTFASYQDYAAGNNFADVINGHATALLNVAIAAGESAENLARYIEILGRLAELEDVTISAKRNGKYKKMGQGMDAAQTEKLNLLRELSSIADKAETEYNDIFKQNTIYSPEYEKSGGDKEDQEKEEYDKEKKRLDNLLERNKISYRKYYDDLKDLGNEHFKKGSENMREHYATLADVRRDAYAKYQGDLDKDLANGLISLQTYYDKSKALSKEWLDGRKANEEDYKEAVEAIYDAVNDAWGDRISQMETRLERMTIDKNWEPGKTEADYWNKMLEELEQDYINGLFDSTDEYYDHRYDLLKKLDEAKKESWENELDAIQESKDSIQDLIDLVSDMMKHELEEQIDALEKQKDL